MKSLLAAAIGLALVATASAQGLIARPIAEDCSLFAIGSDDAVTVNWSCVDVYAAKKDWQDANAHSVAVALKAIRDGSAK